MCSFQFTLLISSVLIRVFSIICIFISTYSRAYSRRLLGATIARNLLPWVLKKIILLEIVKNGVCFGSVSKQNALFPKKCAPNNAPMPILSRICHVFVNQYRQIKYTRTQWVHIIQINIHRNNGIKTNSFTFILMIYWWLKEHLFSRAC